jgi:hypothetical protein
MAKNKRAWEAMVRRDALSVYNRVVERLDKGEDPPSLRFPVSETEFPKLLCLDMKISSGGDGASPSSATRANSRGEASEESRVVIGRRRRG